MTEQEKLERARDTFQTICASLDAQEWKYKKNEEALSLEYTVQGDDLPMGFRVLVDANRQIVMLISLFPFVIEEDKRIDAAIAVSAINNCLVDGCFDFDITSGHVFFRATNTFNGCRFGEDVILYMIGLANATVDKYNDMLLMLSKGMITIEQFLTKAFN